MTYELKTAITLTENINRLIRSVESKHQNRLATPQALRKLKNELDSELRKMALSGEPGYEFPVDWLYGGCEIELVSDGAHSPPAYRIVLPLALAILVTKVEMQKLKDRIKYDRLVSANHKHRADKAQETHDSLAAELSNVEEN